MTLPNTIHLGTFQGVNNRPRHEPYHSLTHALVSGVTMTALVVVALGWMVAL